MAATLALTSSGSISPVSDLDAVPSAAPSREPLMAATLALTAWAKASPNAQPGSDFLRSELSYIQFARIINLISQGSALGDADFCFR